MVGPTLGERRELGRYTVAAGERILYGQRIDGIVRITDRPADKVTTTNRAYLVESAVDSKAELDAIVADYLHEAARLQVVPAAAIPFDRFLADLAAE